MIYFCIAFVTLGIFGNVMLTTMLISHKFFFFFPLHYSIEIMASIDHDD